MSALEGLLLYNLSLRDRENPDLCKIVVLHHLLNPLTTKVYSGCDCCSNQYYQYHSTNCYSHHHCYWDSRIWRKHRVRDFVTQDRSILHILIYTQHFRLLHTTWSGHGDKLLTHSCMVVSMIEVNTFHCTHLFTEVCTLQDELYMNCNS